MSSTGSLLVSHVIKGSPRSSLILHTLYTKSLSSVHAGRAEVSECLYLSHFAGRCVANGHTRHVRQPVDAEGFSHRVRTEHHDKLHAGNVQ